MRERERGYTLHLPRRMRARRLPWRPGLHRAAVPRRLLHRGARSDFWRARAFVGLLALAACNGGAAKPDAGADAYVFPDAPDTPPTLTSFLPTPAQVQPGVPTAITWTWTYMVEPVSPAPT